MNYTSCAQTGAKRTGLSQKMCSDGKQLCSEGCSQRRLGDLQPIIVDQHTPMAVLLQPPVGEVL